MYKPQPAGPDRQAVIRKYSCLVVILVILAFVVFSVLLLRYLRRRATAPATVPTATTTMPAGARAGSILPGAPGPLPELSSKPQPVTGNYQGCPAEGDGGDPALNRLKNRVDEGAYFPVQFDAFVEVPWPKAIERKNRDRWSSSDAAEIARYEGTPVAIEGYLAGAREEGPESPNCHGADDNFRDFHVWLVKTAGDDRSHSIVVEVTPPVRARHTNWRTDLLGQMVKKKQRVRISGWMMLDPEHPDQVGKTRGSIWEIHPIMKIEVNQNGNWVDLDSLR